MTKNWLSSPMDRCNCDANLHQGNLSILTDLGIAIIGFSVGDTIQWNTPEALRRLKVKSIDFQPEAINRHDL